MKKLLIHNNNTILVKEKYFQLVDQILFDVDLNLDVDSYITKSILENQEKIANSDLIFIKISLSENYLEYLGIRLAYHLRLDKKSIYTKPIIFIGPESFYFIGKTCNISDIIFTQNIFKIKDDVESFNSFLAKFKQSTENFDMDEFLKNIHVQPPNNFESNHSIANEWAIIRLFDSIVPLGGNNNYDSLKAQVDFLTFKDSLFFKFKESHINRQNFRKKLQQEILHYDVSDNFTVGIIDDECLKGWYSLYKLIFEKSGISVHTFDNFRKDASRKDLITSIKTWIVALIREKNCFTFILDLRLHDEDFLFSRSTTTPILSGIEIYEYIMSINPGIQIILVTASNKHWNYSRLLKLPVTNFIIKEDPSYELKRCESRQFFLQLYNSIKSSSEKIILAEAYNLIDEIKSLKGSFISDTMFNKKVFNRGGSLDQIYHTLTYGLEDKLILKQCLLICYQTLEYYCKHFEISNKPHSASLDVFDRAKNIIPVIKNNHTNFRYKYGNYEFQTNDLTVKIGVEKLTVDKYLGGDFSDIDTIIAVLLERHNVSSINLALVLKIRYIRNALIAHTSDNINESYEIEKDDILNFIKLLREVCK